MDYKLWPFWFINVFMAWHRHTLLTHFIIQQSPSFEGDSKPTATEHFQSPLYGSGTVFRNISHLLRHFPSSAVARRHTSSNSVTHNYCCHAGEVTLSFVDTLIALTYLLTLRRDRIMLLRPHSIILASCLPGRKPVRKQGESVSKASCELA